VPRHPDTAAGGPVLRRKRGAALLRDFYRHLMDHFGPTGWWPGDTPFEIAIGAILTQNTAWTNVEKAIAELKRRRALAPRRILQMPVKAFEEAIRASGYFRVKARRVTSFCQYLVDNHGGSVRRMAKRPLEELRRELLQVHGIGPETADDILLYACEKPVFVVDAYTRRILSRHGIVAPDIGYETLRAHFEDRLAPDVHVFKEYHGLIVYTGKDYCKSRPNCQECPLARTLKQGQPILPESERE